MTPSDKSYHESGVIEVVDAIINRAIAQQASDIHFESNQKELRVRYRIDGVLYDQPALPSDTALQVLARIKVHANLDVAERRLSQDGKISLNHDNRAIDLRVSTFPGLHGETVVIRILDKSRMVIALESLGLPARIYDRFTRLKDMQNGFFLVVGPTGSGKTTTLYTALSLLNNPEKNIITLEDPVEYNIEGITQGQVQPHIGFTFAKGIRAMLRQDPDVVMVGEIRDPETAGIAVEAALTGHLVLSTLHTNDAVRSLMRLMDMGIEPFLLNASLNGIMAQRLVRMICANCKVARFANEQEQAALKRFGIELEKVFDGAGCDVCFDLGYRGRTGIFELLVISEELRALVVTNPSFDAMYSQAKKDGMITMQEHGIEKLKDGTISVSEWLRVLS